ncbi:DUF4189 domain-containing protein [Terrarubrum flagellatum]|uniref:DUF4189 domain-containing protein n=1 Tax=Terrirubrum flagellatum TaxID=2895980 RepID=UPI0031456A02
MRRRFIVLLAAWQCLAFSAGAADLLSPRARQSPVPAKSVDLKGIWGAVAYSVEKGEHGFFWGADKPDEARDNALKYCEKAGGQSCRIVTLFRNHRHWDDDDRSGFPYEHCAVLSVGRASARKAPFWGAASAKTRREAEEKALSYCGGDAKECKIREWVCT